MEEHIVWCTHTSYDGEKKSQVKDHKGKPQGPHHKPQKG